MPLDVSRLRLLCFDVDGTLRDTDDQFVLSLGRFFQPLSFLFPRKDPLPLMRRMVMATENPGNYLLGLTDQMGIDDELARLVDFFYFRLGLRSNPASFLLIEGVREMLACLKAHYPLAVVSARGQRSTLAFLEKFELAPLFDAIATGQTCDHTKPRPDPILWVAHQLGVAPCACLMVGDTTVDIRAGKAAGAQTVGVLCGFGEEKELRGAGADLILASTADLTGILGK
jgi:phosphoglycolate phosphatase-like HAD superfamily hydrolase